METDKKVIAWFAQAAKFYWRWTTGGSKWRWLPGFGIPLIVIIAILPGGGNKKDTSAAFHPSAPVAANPTSSALLTNVAMAVANATPLPTPLPVDTAAPAPPTATREPPSPTPPPVPTAAPTSTPAPQPVLLNGRGQFASQPITLPAAVSVARISHTGSRNFIVEVYSGSSSSDLLINKIGPYQGVRPLSGAKPITFDIQADGAWNIRIEPIGRASTPAFAGRGDNVSGLFDPPARGAWEISHTGAHNFIVTAHCAGGDDLVQNQIGAITGSRVITFKKGPCFWEVEADGDWSLQPR